MCDEIYYYVKICRICQQRHYSFTVTTFSVLTLSVACWGIREGPWPAKMLNEFLQAS